MQLDYFKLTSSGGRLENEDSVAVRELSDGAVFVVADGLGGHRYGSTASSIVTDTLVNAEDPDYENNDTWITTQLSKANETILVEQNKMGASMKSTAAVLLVLGDTAKWAHVGDSRIYFMRGGRLLSVTEDHSVAFKKYKAGEITRAQLATDEDQPSLLRALGNRDRCAPEVGAPEGGLMDGDAFLLCSDGFWEYVRDEEALIDLLKSDCAEDWAKLMLLRLMGRVKDGNDNFSLITVIAGK